MSGIGETYERAVKILRLDEESITQAKNAPFTSVLIVLATLTIIAAITKWIETGSLSSSLINLVTNFIVFLIMLGFFSGLIWIVAKLVGGRGGYADQTKAIGHAMLILTLPLISGALALFDLTHPALTLLGALFFATGIWFLIAQVQNVKKIHQFGTGKAVASVLIPVILVSLLLFLFITTFLMFFFFITNSLMF